MSEYDPSSEETIFSAALRRLPAERARYLDEACAGQPALHERIEGLLKAQLELGEFLEEPADIGTLGAPETHSWTVPPDEGPGARIGRYKLLQKIGEGGCGVVYMAEQEEPVRRRVALKVIKLGMDTREVIARFEAERQALALMDHPNIAKVLDGGATQTGRPYFVMELVRGIRITEFCDLNRLPARERLDLFIQVCQAVQHAHQKGIIHRDLKPSNILVTIRDPGAPGVPMVIDFGIAKATQGRLTDHTLFTAFEQFLGTPAYMSPEQALMTALDIDTRSDIYSLGVLLYELLTGRTPFEGKDLLAAGIEEMRRTIREKEPLRPSTRLSTLLAAEQATTARFRQTELPKLVHLVRGDLDWIVMKCLEKDRARRYETANALAMDLQRHLKNEPVVARPPSRLYEFQKTVRRHQVGFVATAIVMISLAAGVVVSSRETARARRAELQTRYTGYVADMNLANRALGENDLGMAQAILRRYWPRSGEADLRNWEWRYLAKLSDGDPHVSLVAHSTWVRSLRFLDDDTLLTAGSADWRTILWNVEKQRPSKIITNLSSAGGVSEIMAVAPRRMLMFYRAQWGGTPRMAVVDLRSGREEPFREANRTRPDPDAPITSLDISRDQNSLCVAFGNRVALWDLDQKTWSQPFETESGATIRGLFSPDGRVLVVADESGHVAFWNWSERRKLGVVTNTTGSQGLLSHPVDRELSFSADGQWLVNPSGRWPAKVWRVEDRTLAAELHDSTVAESAVFSPDGRWLAVAGGDASIRLWETSRWQKVRTLRGHTDRVVSMDFSPGGRYLASGARNGEIKLWSIAEPPAAPVQISFPASEYHRIASDGSGFGRILRLLETNGVAAWTAEFWTTAPLQRGFTVALPDGPPKSGVALGGGRGIVLGGFDGSIRIFSSPLGEERVVSNAHGGEVYLMAVSMEGSTLATQGLRYDTQEERVRIWRLPGLELIAELPYARNVHGIQLSDDGKLLVGFTGPGDMGVWEIPSMKGPPMWRGVEALQNVEVCAFSPDNRRLAAAPPDGSLYVWDLATRRRRVLPRALTSYLSLSFSPDGSRLAAGTAEQGKIFDAASGQEVLSFHAAGLLAFARDDNGLIAVRGVAARVYHAPPFAEVQFDWLNERPSEEIPPYRGPDPDYVRPDRPPPDPQNP